MTTANKLADWFSTAKRGDSFVYHIGLLGEDRTRRVGVAETARLAMELAGFRRDERPEQNKRYGEPVVVRHPGMAKVALVQRRKCEFVCEYIAQRL